VPVGLTNHDLPVSFFFMSQILDIEKFLSSFPDYKPDAPAKGFYAPGELAAIHAEIDALVPKNMTDDEKKSFVAQAIEKQHAPLLAR